MHLPAKQKLAAYGAGLLMLGGVSYAGLRSARPDAPMSVAPISGTAPPTRTSPTPDAKPGGSPTPPPTDAPKATEVVVAMAGSVKVPGLLHLPIDARVGDAIKRAGGARPDADLDAINLAAKLVDGDQVYVPSRKAPAPEGASPQGRTARVGRVAARYRGGETVPHYAPLPLAMPPILKGSPAGGVPSHDAPPAEEPVKEELAGDESAPRAAHGHGHRAAKGEPTGLVSLNTADEAELEALPGVGPATAQKILDYRQEHGGFGSVEELTSVKGIGEKKFAKMKPFLKL